MDHAPGLAYHHVQNSPQWVVVVASLFAVAMFSLSAALLRSEEIGIWGSLFVTAWAAVVYLAILNFTRLTVTVDPAAINLKWRLGWPQKTIDRGRVVSVEAHRNTWIAGWGIRKVTRGWMWNVWGLAAVQLELDNGRVFRIGTDDVDGLLTALRR